MGQPAIPSRGVRVRSSVAAVLVSFLVLSLASGAVLAEDDQLHHFHIGGQVNFRAEPASYSWGIVGLRMEGGSIYYVPHRLLAGKDKTYLEPFIEDLHRQTLSPAAWQQWTDMLDAETKPRREVQEAIRNGDYERLEEIVARCRQDGSCLTWTWFLDPLGAFYYDATSLDGVSTESLEAWVEARPKSKAARLALAGHYLHLAWKARGGRPAFLVTEEGYEKFKEWAGKAAEMLDEAKALPEQDRYYYQVAFITGKALGWDRDTMVTLADELRTVAPDYSEAHTEMALYLLPRWHGAPGDMENYIAEAADHLGGREGDKLYTRLCAQMFASIGREEPDFDLPRFERGARAWLADEPDNLAVVNDIAYNALQTRLFELAREAYDQLESRDVPWSRGRYGEYVRYERERRRARLSVGLEGVRMLISIQPEGANRIRFIAGGASIISSGPGAPPHDQISQWSVERGVQEPYARRFHETGFEGRVHDLAVWRDDDELGLVVIGEDAEGQTPQRSCTRRRRGVTGTVKVDAPLRAVDVLDGQEWYVVAGGASPTSVSVMGATTKKDDWSVDVGFEVLGVAASPDAKTCAAVGADGKVALVNLASHEAEKHAATASGEPLVDAVYSPDGQVLFAAEADGAIHLLDSTTLEETGTIDAPGDLREIAVSPTDTFLASAHGGQNFAVLWDWTSRREIRKLVGHSGEVTTVDFHPSGELVGTGSLDGSIRLWEVEAVPAVE